MSSKQRVAVDLRSCVKTTFGWIATALCTTMKSLNSGFSEKMSAFSRQTLVGYSTSAEQFPTKICCASSTALITSIFIAKVKPSRLCLLFRSLLGCRQAVGNTSLCSLSRRKISWSQRRPKELSSSDPLTTKENTVHFASGERLA